MDVSTADNLDILQGNVQNVFNKLMQLENQEILIKITSLNSKRTLRRNKVKDLQEKKVLIKAEKLIVAVKVAQKKADKRKINKIPKAKAEVKAKVHQIFQHKKIIKMRIKN